MRAIISFLFFFFNDTATTEIYTLSLHDALPISFKKRYCVRRISFLWNGPVGSEKGLHFPFSFCTAQDRKSTRLNSSHANISYAVFCLKKKKNINPSMCVYIGML